MQWTGNVTLATVFAAGIVVAATPDLAHAQQQFPVKPVRMIVPATAGGQFDTLARIIGKPLGETWRQPVVIDNRAGAGGILGTAAAAKATPDGHTLLIVGSAFMTNAILNPGLPYDTLKDFAGVTQIGYPTFVLAAAPTLGVQSVKDLIAAAKAQPGKIIYGSGQLGSGNHLAGARFYVAAGLKVTTVAFKGIPEATIEVVAGRSHFTVAPLVTALPFVKDGKLLALAVTTPRRSSMLPDVPALAESLPEFKQPESSTGMVAPAGTPRVILNQISKEVARVLDLTDIRIRLQSLGISPAPATPESFDRIMREQMETLSKFVVAAGLKAK